MVPFLEKVLQIDIIFETIEKFLAISPIPIQTSKLHILLNKS